MKKRGVAVLGAGSHGGELARLFKTDRVYDDLLVFRPISAATGPYVIGAVWPKVRRQIAEKAKGTPHRNGLVIFPGAKVSKVTKLGAHVHVLYNAVVSHGCRLGDFVTVCSGAVLAGEVTVGDDVFIGANATVIHGGITIGRGAVIGAGAVVTRDVPAGATVKGVPAC